MRGGLVVDPQLERRFYTKQPGFLRCQDRLNHVFKNFKVLLQRIFMAPVDKKAEKYLQYGEVLEEKFRVSR